MSLLRSKHAHRHWLVLVAMLMLILGATSQAVRADDPTGTVQVTKSILGGLTEVDSGVEFTYVLDYKYASTLADGANVTLVDVLPPELSKTASQVTLGTTSHIASTSYNASTGEAKWTFNTPLDAGASGQLTLKVRFPNGSTPNGTVATNTATMDADNAEPNTSAPVSITAAAQCKWTTNISGTSNPALNTNVTYRATLQAPGANTGNLNVIAPSTMTMTLPPGVLPGDVVNTNGGVISGTGVGGDPVIVTWTLPNPTTGTTNRDVVVRFDSTRFANGNQVTVTNTTDLTVVGNEKCGGAKDLPATLSDPAPGGTVAKGRSVADVTPGTRSFYYTLDANNTGNVDLDNFTIEDPLPQNFALESVRLPTVTNGPGGNFINLVYKRSDTGNTEYTWPGSLFPEGTTTLPVSALSLSPGVYVSYVRFEFGSVAYNFNINDTIRLNGKLLTTGWGNPPRTLVNGDTVCNEMTFTAKYGGSAAFDPKTASNCVTVIPPTVRPAVEKSILSGSSIIPGGTTTWRVIVSNPDTSDIPMVNPMGMDLLPAGVEYVPGTFNANTTGTYNSSGVPDPTSTLQVIDNYDGTGRQLLRWTYSHSFAVNTRSTVEFQTKVKLGAPPATLPNRGFVSVVPGAQSGPVVYTSSVTDANDLNGNNDKTDKIGQSSAVNLFVTSAASLDSYKLVKGQLDSDYSRYPDIGQTSPGGTADYKLVVTNSGNVSLKNVVVIDILPFIGDTAVTSTTARASEFDLFLAGPVSAPSGVTVEYSVEKNPCRDEMGSPSPFPGGCAAPNWSAVPPVDITTVHSLRFDFGSLILGPLDQFELNWPMRAPVNAPSNGEVAWNSFGVVATRADTNSKLLPTEPIKVGVASEPPVPAAYGDKVWNDLNRDGIQDSGEPGINGVRVELYRDNGDGVSDPDTDEYVGFTLTDVNGEYLFTNLPAGDYYAVFFKPPTFAGSPNDQGSDDTKDSDGISSTVRGFPAYIAPVTTLDALEDDRTWDQGFYQPEPPVAAVGNYVWNDLNSDGIQNEPASAGLNGITVNLYDSNDNLIGTRVTADDVNGNPGYYLFDGLTPGDYYLEFVRPTGFTFTTQNASGSNPANDSDANTGTGKTASFPLAGGQYDPTWDAGMILPKGTLSLGDRVWNDADSDGIYEPGNGEAGVNGVRLNLYQDTDGDGEYTPGVDQFFAMTTTFTQGGAPGYYEFKDLPAGDYIVQVDPSNFIAGGPLAGLESSPVRSSTPNDDVDHDNNGLPLTGHGVVSNAITLSSGSEPAGNGNHNPTLDFGFSVPLGQIGDTIWFDKDGDGTQDPGEPGIPNITVTLTPPAGVDLGAGAGNPVTTTTDPNGKYLFDGLPPGDYTVTVTPPAGMTNTGDPDGGFDNTSDLTLGLGEKNLDQDFGYRYPGKIGDTIWFDKDGDGVQDVGESGIGNVVVQLTPPSGVDLGAGAGNPITTPTDSNGNYLFDNLPLGGVYKVEVLPSNFGAGKPLEGMTNTGDPDSVKDGKSEVTLTTNKPENLDQDFGYQYAGQIGDTIWRDDNGDGDQDPGEPGIPGITVTLTPPANVDLGGGPGVPVSKTTDPNGKYLFDKLPPGDYTVTVTPPAGMNNTGDPDGGFDNTSDLTLGAGEKNLDQDFGYQPYIILTPSYLVTRVAEGVLTGHGSIACYWITLSAKPDGDVIIDVDPSMLLKEITIDKSQITLNASNWNSLTTTNLSNFLCVRPVDDSIDEPENDQCGDKSADMTSDVLPYSEECGDHKEFAEHKVSPNSPANTGYTQSTPWVNRTLTFLGRPEERYLEVLVSDNDKAEVLITESFAITDLDESGSPVGKACYWVTLGSKPLNPVTITITPDGKEVTTDKTQVIRDASNWNKIDAGFADQSNMVCVTPINENDIDPPNPNCWTGSNTMLGQPGLGTEKCGTHMGSIGHSVSSVDPKYATAPFRNTNGPDFDNNQSTIDTLVRNDDVARLVFQPATLNLLAETQTTFEVSLASRPKEDVIVSNATTELVFQPANWNVPQSVVAEAPDTAGHSPETHFLGFNVRSADLHFQNLVSEPVQMTVIPNSGVFLSSTTIRVSETGQTSTYELALTSQPKANVEIALTTDGQLAVEPATLQFTPANWNQSQQVTVRAVDDKVAEEGTHQGQIFHTVTSDDGKYQGLVVTDIIANITDNDVAAVVASRTTLAVSEDGQEATYDVVLQSQPTGTVVVKIDGGGQVTTVPAMLVFAPDNWNIAQAVQVRAIDDDVDEGGTHATALTHKSESSDPFYNGYEPVLSITVTDNDVAGAQLSRTIISPAIGEADTYTVVLTSRPTSGVMIDLVAHGDVVATNASCVDTDSEGSNNCVLFTPENWNVPQTVTVQSNGTGFISHIVTSADGIYRTLKIEHVLVNALFRLFLPISQGN